MAKALTQKRGQATKGTVNPIETSASVHTNNNTPLENLYRSIGNQALQKQFQPLVQAKLKLGQVNDKYEQQADQVAAQVLRMPEQRLPGEMNKNPDPNNKIHAQPVNEKLIQSKPQLGKVKARSTQSNNVSQWSADGGRPLSASERNFFEPRLARDLSNVRLHQDPRSAQAAESIGARAFTVGQHIFFAKEEVPSKGQGSRKLLAHELVHTQQQGSDRRIARQCQNAWSAVPIPSGISSLTANVGLDLGQLRITDNVSVSPVVGQVRVKFFLPRALQQRIMPSALGGLLQQMQIIIDVSGQLRSSSGTSAAARFPNNELCLVVTFSQAQGGAWQADIRILGGSRLEIPLVIGVGTPLRAPPASNLGTGVANISLRLRQDLTASVGALRLNSTDDFKAVWSRIIDQVKNSLQVPISNIRVPLDARLRAALSVPLPVPGRAPGGGSPLLVHTVGDIRLRTDISSTAGRYRLRLSGDASGTAFGGLVSLELSGRGRLRGPLPSQVRLGDLSTDFVSNLLAQSSGGGEISGRFRAFGLPGRLDAGFSIREGRLVGNASVLSPVGVGRGLFQYGINEGLSAQMGMLGLVNLTIAPAQERLNAQARRGIGPQPYDFGTSVTGLGATGLLLTPGSTAILSLGAGPQLITTPTGDAEIGVYGGIDFRLRFFGP